MVLLFPYYGPRCPLRFWVRIEGFFLGSPLSFKKYGHLILHEVDSYKRKTLLSVQI